MCEKLMMIHHHRLGTQGKLERKSGSFLTVRSSRSLPFQPSRIRWRVTGPGTSSYRNHQQCSLACAPRRLRNSNCEPHVQAPASAHRSQGCHPRIALSDPARSGPAAAAVSHHRHRLPSRQMRWSARVVGCDHSLRKQHGGTGASIEFLRVSL